MSTLTPQQLVAAQQAGLETLFGLTTKAFEGIEKLVALNLQVAKATLAESQELATMALSAKSPSELFALSASLSQPAAEKMAAYGRFVESLAKNAPAGSETAVAAWKSAFSAANATYESDNKAAKQFVATVAANA